MTTIEARPDLLTDEMLQRFDERCPMYDRDNRFFQEDWDELRAAGYLNIALPTKYGGMGMSLGEVNRLQRKLAYYAPATAVAVNMHLYWVGTAATVHAAGHGEAGNDLPLLLSTTKAERVDGGWESTGHKIFGSLSPVWTYLGLHAMDTSNPEAPQIVHAFLHRDASRYRIEDTWDTLGMRATVSNDTILDKTFIPDAQIALVCPAGFAGAGLLQLGIFAWGLLGFAGIYAAIAQRTYDDVVKRMHERTSIALTRSMAYHPGVQHYVAEMRINLESMDAHLDRLVEDWSNGVDYGMDWPVKIVAGKYDIVNRAWSVVDTAFDLTGGSGIF